MPELTTRTDEEVIVEFYEADQAIKTMSKRAEPLKADLKDRLQDRGTTDAKGSRYMLAESDGLTILAKLERRVSVTANLDKVREYCEEIQDDDLLSRLVKTVEVVDTDELERATQEGLVGKEEAAAMCTVKETFALTVKAEKRV